MILIQFSFIDFKKLSFVPQVSWSVSILRTLCGSQGFSCRRDSSFRQILCPVCDLHTLNLLDMRTCLCNAGRTALAKGTLIHVRCLAGIVRRHFELLLKIADRLCRVLGRQNSFWLCSSGMMNLNFNFFGSFCRFLSFFLQFIRYQLGKED